LTALHYAYLKEDRESIRILLSGGAPSSVEDRLGRRPRDVLPEGSDLADFLGEEIGTGEGPPHIEHSTTTESNGTSTGNLRHSPRPEILALGEVGAVGGMDQGQLFDIQVPLWYVDRPNTLTQSR